MMVGRAARPRLAVGVMLGACLALLGCETCEREGCDALTVAAGNNGSSRVAGVVASESDLVSNGCQECGFTSAQMYAWAREGEVTSEAEAREVAVGMPLARSSAGGDGRYSLELDEGAYLVCFNISCFNAVVAAGKTTTVNVRLINGVSSAYVASPETGALVRVDAVWLPLDLVPAS